MSTEFTMYPKGFLFTDLDLNHIPRHYKNKSIINKFNYYYHGTMTPQYEVANDHFIVIHGDFTYVEPGSEINNEQFPKHLLKLYINDYSGFLDALDFLGGRYVIIIGKENQVRLYQDAVGARSVFYSLEYNIASSHVHFINDVLPHEKEEVAETFKDYGITWDMTPYKNIKSMVPNLSLDFHSKKKKRFFPRKNNHYNNYSVHERLTLFETVWKKQYESYFSNYNRIVLSFTGGWDSRVSLAMLKDYKDKIEFFTYTTRENSDVGEKDKRLLLKDGEKVREILNDIPLNHKFIIFEDGRNKLTTDEQEVINKNEIRKHTKSLLYSYKKLFQGDNVLHIRSNIHEIGRAIYVTKNAANDISKLKSYFINYYSRVYGEIIKQNEINLVRIAEDGVHNFDYNKDLYDYHILDLYYWESRMGRWHTEILNETDVCFETFTPFNVRALIDISLSFNFEQRKSNYMFAELINRNYPILNFYGKNDPKNLYEQYKEASLNNNFNTGDEYKDLKAYNQKSSSKIYDKLNKLDKLTQNNFEKLYKEFKELKQNNYQESNNTKKEEMNKKDIIVNHFDIIHSDEKKKVKINVSEQNTLYIPFDKLTKGNQAVFDYEYTNERGFLSLSVINTYSSDNATDYLQYEIHVNNNLLLYEDISHWKFENNLNLFNLKRGDKVSIRVKVLRDINSQTWERVSKLNLLSFEEKASYSEESVNITATSPYSEIIGKNNS